MYINIYTYIKTYVHTRGSRQLLETSNRHPRNAPGPPQTPHGAPGTASAHPRDLLRPTTHVLAGARSTP